MTSELNLDRNLHVILKKEKTDILGIGNYRQESANKWLRSFTKLPTLTLVWTIKNLEILTPN